MTREQYANDDKKDHCAQSTIHDSKKCVIHAGISATYSLCQQCVFGIVHIGYHITNLIHLFFTIIQGSHHLL